MFAATESLYLSGSFNDIHICIAPYGRNFRGAGPGSVLVGVRSYHTIFHISTTFTRTLVTLVTFKSNIVQSTPPHTYQGLRTFDPPNNFGVAPPLGFAHTQCKTSFLF